MCLRQSGVKWPGRGGTQQRETCGGCSRLSFNIRLLVRDCPTQPQEVFFDIRRAPFSHSAIYTLRRPAVVVQADIYNSQLRHFIVAEITTNLAAASDPASLLIDVSTPEGRATGLDQNSVVCCLFLATVAEIRITKLIGKLSDAMNAQLDDCLKVALQLP